MILDSGAISALALGDPELRRALQRAVARGVSWKTSAAVVAETTTGRGPADARTNRVLGRLRLVPVDEGLARRAGALRFAARRPGVVDAMVVATAEAGGGGIVVTGDVDDMSALAAVARGVRVQAW